MSGSLKRIVVSVLFFGLLGIVAVRGSGGSLSAFFARLTGQSKPESTSPRDESQNLSRYGFHLVEAAHDAGIDFRHEAPTLDSRLTHIMPLVNPMGAAVSLVDFNVDGHLDMYVVTSSAGGRNALYRNRGDGTFENVADQMGVSDLNHPGTGASMGSIWADYDNDGFPDLLVYKWGRPELFHNRDGQGFDRVTAESGLPEWVNANSACWFDYDRDGRLDLFIAGYWPDDVNLWELSSTKIMPESFEYAKNGGRKYLLHNRGDGRFEDVTTALGITSTRWTLGVAAADLTGSGYQDLVLANDYGVSEFYVNRKGERFEELGYETGIGVAPKSGMSVSLGDVLNEGRPAIYVSNITEPGNLVQGNNLWVVAGETSSGLPRYLNQAGTLNIERGGWSWGARFGDLNNDGWLDLYLTNGYISADQGKSYWYDYGKIAGGLKGLIGDAVYWPPIGDQGLSGYQSKCVWMNKGGDFIDVAAAVGASDVYDGRAVAMGDLSNRGVLDVVVANQKGPLLLYRNSAATENGWIQFQLEGGARPGNEAGWSNRDAIGAEVVLEWRSGKDALSHRQVQIVAAGDAYASQNMLRLHFGLGTEPQIDKVTVKWPSGRLQTVASPSPGELHRINETDLEVVAR